MRALLFGVAEQKADNLLLRLPLFLNFRTGDILSHLSASYGKAE